MRAACDGSLLARIESDPGADPTLLALLREASEVPGPKERAWVLRHLLAHARTDPVPPGAIGGVGRNTRWRRRRKLLFASAGALAVVLAVPAGVRLAWSLGWTLAPSRAETRDLRPVRFDPGLLGELRRGIDTRRRLERLLVRAPRDAEAIGAVLRARGDGPLVANLLHVAETAGAPDSGTVFAWSRTPEWDSALVALRRDRGAILRVARETGLSPRLVALPALCEQLRRAESFRDRYKRLFGRFVPTGSLSMGVTGVKPETLRRLRPWCDPALAPWLDGVPDDTLRARLGSPDPLWAYRYGALCLSAIACRWRAAGIELSDRPEILLTAYNLGENRCPPRPDPRAGGAVFRLGGREYTFGSFAWEFYGSARAWPLLPY